VYFFELLGIKKKLQNLKSCGNLFLNFQGSFKNSLNCEVIDKMIDHESPLVVFDKAITQVPIKLIGSSIAISTTAVPKYSGG